MTEQVLCKCGAEIEAVPEFPLSSKLWRRVGTTEPCVGDHWHEPAAGTDHIGDDNEMVAAGMEGDAMALTETQKEREDFAKVNRAAWPNNATSPATQSPPSRPEPALPELMHADAVTKLELWKQNQALLQQLKALKQSHAALVKALKDLNQYSRPSNWHELDPDFAEETAKEIAAWKALDAVLADAKKVTE